MAHNDTISILARGPCHVAGRRCRRAPILLRHVDVCAEMRHRQAFIFAGFTWRDAGRYCTRPATAASVAADAAGEGRWPLFRHCRQLRPADRTVAFLTTATTHFARLKAKRHRDRLVPICAWSDYADVLRPRLEW